MTTATFKYIEPGTWSPEATAHPHKPWSKVDGPDYSFKLSDRERSVTNLRSLLQSTTSSSSPHTNGTNGINGTNGTKDASPVTPAEFTTDTVGFSVHHAPAAEKIFTDDRAIRDGYYAEVESHLRAHLPSGKDIKKVVIFDHTIRRRDKFSPRQPVQQVHVDQTPGAAEVRVRRHVATGEAEELLKGRYQIVNVWRPIENPATDFPLAVVDWRSTTPLDFVKVDLLYPKRSAADSASSTANTTTTTTTATNATTATTATNGHNAAEDDDDDRGKEVLPTPTTVSSTENYEVKGETFGVAPNPAHKFYYVKDMTPDETMFIKCFDSRGEGLPEGREGLARCTPHTAFVDPETPEGAPGRQSIEVRCLVFYN